MLCKTELTVGDGDTELQFMASIRTRGLHKSRGHYLTDGGKMDEITIRKSKAKVATRVS